MVMSSCSSVYMPNVPNTPMLSTKGELSTGGHITLKGNASFNSAYAVGEHVGVMLNGSLMNNSGKKKDFRHNLLEAGGGYFTTFGPGFIYFQALYLVSRLQNNIVHLLRR